MYDYQSQSAFSPVGVYERNLKIQLNPMGGEEKKGSRTERSKMERAEGSFCCRALHTIHTIKLICSVFVYYTELEVIQGVIFREKIFS